MKTIRTITLTPCEAKLCEFMLNRLEADPDSEDVPLTRTAIFGGGYEADIKLCNGDSPYAQVVLFFDGFEVHTLEVTDTMEGEYCFHDNEDEYVVHVEYPVITVWQSLIGS